MTFTHTPRPPTVWETHPTPRYFFKPTHWPHRSVVSLMRHADELRAKLTLQVNHDNASTAMSQRLTADECERLGLALLDAAHDLRAHPTPNEENE